MTKIIWWRKNKQVQSFQLYHKKEDENLHAYYRRTETLLIKILEKDRVIHNGENVINLNNAEQHISKNTIAKFGFGLKILELCLYMIKIQCVVFMERLKKPRHTLMC